MRSGPQEPGDKPLVLPAASPTSKPAKSITPPAPVSEFERGNYLPDGLRERPAAAPTSDVAGSIGGDSEWGMFCAPSPKWDWGMAE